MEQAQRAIYDGIRLAMHSRVRAAIADKGLARSGIIILDALLKLRQACCDPRLLKTASLKQRKSGSAKFERLMEMLPPLLEDVLKTRKRDLAEGILAAEGGGALAMTE